MLQTLCRSRFVFVIAYVVLGAIDFLYFLYSRNLSVGVTACIFVFLAIGWNWWFGRLAEENKVTKLNLDAPTESNHGKR
jgi:hypothetical protein